MNDNINFIQTSSLCNVKLQMHSRMKNAAITQQVTQFQIMCMIDGRTQVEATNTTYAQSKAIQFKLGSVK